jgi:SAM-dependent methyltransferase
MELTWPGLADTQHAFDAVAPTYDADNAANPLICDMRARARALVTRLVPAGASLLDLGCGPGADAEWFGRRGYRVTAIDWSQVMVRHAGDRIRAAGLDGAVTVTHGGIHELDRLALTARVTVDGAYSNLGPLNCVPNLADAARSLAAHIRPGGLFVASVIGRICPWEIARYGMVGQWARAALRFKRGFVAVPLEGRIVWTQYYSPARFARVFAEAGFSLVSLEAMGLLLPPPYLNGFAGRHAKLMHWLGRVERRVAALPAVRQCGDHFLIAMRRG